MREGEKEREREIERGRERLRERKRKREIERKESNCESHSFKVIKFETQTENFTNANIILKKLSEL